MAALDVLVDEKLDERAEVLGQRFRDGLRAIDTSKLADIRGMGLLNAIELKPDVGEARGYSEKLKDLGVLAKETHVTTIRFAPPLIITLEQIDWLVGRVKEALA